MFEKIIVLLGPVGSGKSLQAELIAKDEGLEWISTGRLLRQSDEQWVIDKLKTGILFEDTEVQDVLRARIETCAKGAKGFVLDGFPRRTTQAAWLDSYLADNFSSSVRQAIHVVVSEQEARARLIERGRADDIATAIAQRNKEYMENVLPVVEYYQDKDILSEVDGEGTIEEVTKRIEEIVES